MSDTLKDSRTVDMRFFLFMVPAFILWLVGQFALPMLPTDQLNVIIPYFAENFGYTAEQVTDPASIGRFVLIPLTLVLGNIIIRFGAKKAFVFFLAAQGLFEVFIAYGKIYPLLWIGMFLMPIFGVGCLMATFSLIRTWFRNWRGTALGIVTAVSPLSNAITIKMLGGGTESIGFEETLSITGAAIFLLGILGIWLVKSSPRDVGCHPDGALVAPPPEQLADDALVNKIRFRHVLKHKEAWYHIIIFGILLSSLTAYPAFFVPRFAELGFDEGDVTKFTFFFSILGAVLSLISGIVDQKMGTKKATLLLVTLFLLGAVGLRFGNPDREWMIWLGIVALGGVIGAAPNLNPSLIVHFWGRKCFDHAYKYTYTVLNIFPAAVLYLTSFLFTKTGSFNTMYMIEIVFAVIAFILIILYHRHIDLTADVLYEDSRKRIDLTADVKEDEK